MLTVSSRSEISDTRGKSPQTKYSLSMGQEYLWKPATSPTHGRGLGCLPDDPNTHLTSTHTLSSSHLTASPPVPSWNWPLVLSQHEEWRAIPPTSTPHLLQRERILWTWYLNIKEGLFPKHIKASAKSNSQMKTNPEWMLTCSPCKGHQSRLLCLQKYRILDIKNYGDD